MQSFVGVLLCLLSSFATAANPYEMHNLQLLQPEAVLSERVASLQEMAAYIKSVNAAALNALSNEKPAPNSGFLVIAVRPGGAHKVWLDFSPFLSPISEAQLRSAVEAVHPFVVKNGVVVFAINATLWGAPPSQQQGPHPAEWMQEIKRAGHPLEIGDLVDRVWPPKPGT